MDSSCASEMNDSSNADDESTFITEVEVLREICEEDIHVNESPNASEVCITLHPATAGNKDAQYVCLTLLIQVTSQYPDVPASFQFKNPRGMSEDELERISQDLKKLAEEKKGCEMMYDLIQAAKDSLTENNSPSLPCTICQCLFEESDVFTKTSCYHYFHSFCLARYLQFAEEDEDEEPRCPVCRETLDAALLKDLCDAPEPSNNDSSDVEITSEMRQHQEEMKLMFERQKAKGGHIDIEAENNKHLISIRHVPTTSIEDMVSQQLRNSKLAATDSKNVQEQSTSAAEPTQRNPKDGAPVFMHSNKHHNHRGGHHGNHQRSRGRGEGRGYHRSYPRHTGERDERSRSGRGHQRSEQKWTGNRDRHVERSRNNRHHSGERKNETDNGRIPNQPRESRSADWKTTSIDDEKDHMQQNREMPKRTDGDSTDGKGTDLVLSASGTLANHSIEKESQIGKDEMKKSDESEEIRKRKVDDDRMGQEKTSSGRRNERRPNPDRRDNRNKENKDRFQHRNDMKRQDREYHQRKQRSDLSGESASREGSEDMFGREDLGSRNNDWGRGGQRGHGTTPEGDRGHTGRDSDNRMGKDGSSYRQVSGRDDHKGGTGRGKGHSRGGGRRGGSNHREGSRRDGVNNREGLIRGEGSRSGRSEKSGSYRRDSESSKDSGRSERDGTKRGSGISSEAEKSRVTSKNYDVDWFDKSNVKSSGSEATKARPPPGFDAKPMVKVETSKPPPGFDFR